MRRCRAPLSGCRYGFQAEGFATGGLNQLQRLLHALHRRGMRAVLDFHAAPGCASACQAYAGLRCASPDFFFGSPPTVERCDGGAPYVSLRNGSAPWSLVGLEALAKLARWAGHFSRRLHNESAAAEARRETAARAAEGSAEEGEAAGWGGAGYGGGGERAASYADDVAGAGVVAAIELINEPALNWQIQSEVLAFVSQAVQAVQEALQGEQARRVAAPPRRPPRRARGGLTRGAWRRGVPSPTAGAAAAQLHRAQRLDARAGGAVADAAGGRAVEDIHTALPPPPPLPEGLAGRA